MNEVSTGDGGEDGGAGGAVDVVGNGLEAALDVDFVSLGVGAQEDELAPAVERVRHVVERVEVRVAEHGRCLPSGQRQSYDVITLHRFSIHSVIFLFEYVISMAIFFLEILSQF